MGKSYEERKEQVAEILRQKSVKGRDIGPLPSVEDPARRESCRLDFRRFCKTYFPSVFTLRFSEDHLRVIDRIETAVRRGGLFAVAMPRGSGKTSLCLAAAEWAICFGYRPMVVLIGATEDAAVELLDHVRTTLETNDLLAADFPEVCHPFRCLEGIVHRTHGQLLNGEPTRLSLTAKEIVFPTVPGSLASGSVVRVAGVTGRIRGMMAVRPSDGATLRPSLVLADDLSTDEASHSPQQTRRRLSTVTGAVLGLAGPGKKIAGLMPCTVIAKGDLADQVLDRKQHPIWQGERIRLLTSMPTNVTLWEAYAEARAAGLREGRGMRDATAFYLAHRAELDEGASASWPARYNADEASAIQHGMNLRLTSEEAFWAEYQNEPMTLEAETPLLLRPEQVLAKISDTLMRGVVPAWATKLTAGVDVQGSILFYCVTAWSNEFTGHVVDYGSHPQQPGSNFLLREVKNTLALAAPGVSFEGQLRAGLDALTERLLSKDWATDAGGTMRINRLVVDAGYRDDVVKQFAKDSKFAALIIPSKGFGITADRKPLNSYEPREGERAGWNWRHRLAKTELQIDTHSWKTLLAQRILSNPGEAGNLTVFHGSAVAHTMFSEHVTAEYATPTEGLGRVVQVWRPRAGRENHFLDCLVMTAVAASEQGILMTGHQPANGQSLIKRKRRPLQVSF